MLQVIGIGPGRLEWLPPAIPMLAQKCDILLGGSRALKLFPDYSGQKYCLSGDLTHSLAVIKNALQEKQVVGVLVSGDPGFFSFLPRLKQEFPEESIAVYPGISSLQFAFAKAGLAWQDAAFVSVHGRELSVLPKRITNPTAVLTGGENTPQKVAQLYLERGYNPTVSIGNALGYPEEVWETMDAEQLAREKSLFENAIVILYPTISQGNKPCSDYRIGIPDQEFLRGEVPMTKAEIRVQVLAKAQITLFDRIVDIGAGTGSISIEAAHLAAEGIVYAVEHDPEAQELILSNKRKFGVTNLSLISGTAPDVFGKLPPVDVCIVGGSSGRMRSILENVPLLNGGRIVITAVTIETLTQGLSLLKDLNYQEIDIVSIQAVRWKEVHHLHMAHALNQVFILSARKEEKV